MSSFAPDADHRPLDSIARKHGSRSAWFFVALGCGIACSPIIWIGAHPFELWMVAVGAIAGFAYGVPFTYSRGAMLSSAFTAAALAVPLWMLIDVLLLPIVSGHPPLWNAAGMRAVFPALIGWLLYGLALGTTVHLAARFVRPGNADRQSPAMAPAKPTRVVILGGGFGGTTTAMKLEKALEADLSVSITLISDVNSLLFTPMLAEVAGSSIEPTHISSPLRSSLRRTQIVRARASSIDLDRASITLHAVANQDEPREVEYDHLVLALGGVSNFFGQENVKRVALDFKSLTDAIRIRNHVIELFERADREPDTMSRERLLTIVIAGGGFAGIELAGALNDFTRGIAGDYMNVRPEEIHVVVVHARERILPELSETLAAYALTKMMERGVTFQLNAHVSDATCDTVTIDRGQVIAANTLIWTAGTTPHPLVGMLDVERDKRGAVVVDARLAVPNRNGLWALGDCAAIPIKSGGTYPPTAQHALREATTLAHNILGSVRQQTLADFSFEALGSLCVIGYQTACAEVRVPFTQKKLLFSGAFAWLLWRGIYLAKLPGFERKIRVLVDWTTELFYTRDTVQTTDA